MCNEGCKREFSPRNFKLWHWSTDDFTKSAWLPLAVLVGFRVVTALICTVIWMYNVITDNFFFVFFTNWTFTVVLFCFLASSAMSLHQLISECRARCAPGENPSKDAELGPVLPEGATVTQYGDDQRENGPQERDRTVDALKVRHKIMWLAYNIGANMSLFLTIGYWTVIYDPNETQSVTGVFKHVFLALFCIVDTALSGIPVRIYHSVYSLAFTAVYLTFTVIYWRAGGKDNKGNPYIYSALNYNNMTATQATTVAFFFFVVIPVVQLLYFGLYKLRNKLVSSRCY